jgi:asparagine synthase (glutamine-hydrolysing)
MCGIVGQVKGDRAVEPRMLEEMCAALEHRGPDARGVTALGRAGLGVQRLRIIDLATGDQPIFNEDGTIAVVLNGEIYNYRELRERLERAGHRFSTRTDTEVIVHLYEDHGVDCVRRLHGMFGLAIWDAGRGRLILARDRVGKKPLFYAHRGADISFASELNALMRDPEVDSELDHEALDAYFAYGYVPAPLSAFRAVRKLPPATTLIHDGASIECERYWRLEYEPKREVKDLGELHEQVREAITRAVKRRMISDVPLGAFLSGGIDSSAVVAAMADASPQPVKTFSIGFSSDRFNELPHARRVAERFGTDHHEFLVDPDAVAILPGLARQYGEPFADSSALPSFHLAQLARRNVTVALNGDGGDESFAGYQRYVANLVLHRLGRLPGPLRRAAARAGGALPRSARIDDRRNKARRLLVGLGLDRPARYNAYMSHLDGLNRDELYSDDYRRIAEESRGESAVDVAWHDSRATSVVDAMLATDVGTYLPGDLLVKVDIATMAHSLEARSPFLDHELMELAASIPAELKVRGTEKKIVLRDALREWLPDDILDRPKQGFELPIAEWFRGDLREFGREILLDDPARSRGYFRPQHVERMFERHVEGSEDNARGLWTLLMFELWHREVPDRLGARRALASPT